jgi:hypothetical protein
MMNKKNVLSAAVATALGFGFAPQAAMADIITADWTGLFTMLDSGGAALANTSITTKGANQFQTTVTGTMSFDTDTGSGSATLVPFDFFAGTAPAAAVGISFQAIGDGMGGPGSLVLGNMLFNWNGNNGIPVNLVLDAAGFFGGLQGGALADGNLTQAEVAGFGAVPASDGTYINATWGYLGVGAVPMATTEWNTTLAPGCLPGADGDFTTNTGGGCMGVSPSGALPLVTDTAPNGNEFAQGDGFGIGGNPMADGPFGGFNANFDMTAMTNVVITPTAIPVPAAVWLFGSGLLGLVGIARRKKQA